MRRPPRPGEMIVVAIRAPNRFLLVRVRHHNLMWIHYGPRVYRGWRVHRFDEGKTWWRDLNDPTYRAMRAAEALA